MHLQEALAGTRLETRCLEEHARDVAAAQRQRKRAAYREKRAEARREAIRSLHS